MLSLPGDSMKTYLLILAAVFSAQAFGTTKSFDIKSEIYVNGKLISSPHIKALPNEKALINQGDSKGNNVLSLEVMASDFANDSDEPAIQLNFKVTYTNAKNETVTAQHNVTATSGEPAMITLTDKDTVTKVTQDKLKIKVIATRLE
jgi:hypothetical protein